MTILRPATPTDAGRLAGILSGFIDDTPWMPRIHTRAEDLAHVGQLIQNGWVTVAETGPEVAGFLAREGATIHALYVSGAHRNLGVGRALLDHAKAAEPRLRLWTFQANTGAQRFYRRAGFTETQRTSGACNDERLPDIEYVWERSVP